MTSPSVVIGLLALASGAGAYVLGSRAPLADRPPARSLSGRAADMRYVARATPLTGREIALVFVGGSTCGPSNTASLPSTIDSLKVMLQTRAAGEQSGFVAIGVAKDRSLAAGLAFLEKFGPFEEISAGHGWSNTAMARYVFGAARGPAATPQVLVVARQLSSDGTGRSVDHILMRKVGLQEIQTWVRNGAPLPARR